mgnify:CR=1 FL=1
MGAFVCRDRAEKKRALEQVFALFPILAERRTQSGGTLSGGEQQRIVIARALLNDPKLILADEPTGNLDPETSGQILQLLHDISRRGTSVVMTTHNYTLVHNYPARIVKCENGLLCDLNSDKEGE